MHCQKNNRWFNLDIAFFLRNWISFVWTTNVNKKLLMFYTANNVRILPSNFLSVGCHLQTLFATCFSRKKKQQRLAEAHIVTSTVSCTEWLAMDDRTVTIRTLFTLKRPSNGRQSVYCDRLPTCYAAPWRRWGTPAPPPPCPPWADHPCSNSRVQQDPFLLWHNSLKMLTSITILLRRKPCWVFPF